MEKRYYNASSLERSLQAFEQGYAMASGDFYAAHEADDPAIAHIPRRHRHAWASFYREWRLLSDDDLSAVVERDLVA